MNEQRQDVFRVADEIFSQRPSWVTFFREVLGVDGIVRQMYSSPETLSHFEQTPEYQKIQQMLARLRESAMTPRRMAATVIIDTVTGRFTENAGSPMGLILT